MKRLLILCAAFLALVSCTKDTKTYGRVDQIDLSVPAPAPVMIKSVRPTPGGAVIKVTIPDDDNLKGVIAEFERNGQMVNTKISRYVDSLEIEGFPDTQIHTITISSFNVNEVKSEPVTVDVFPLEPPIMTVRATMEETFGGVKVHILGNEALADLAVCLLADSELSDSTKAISDRKWVEVTTMFTASNDIKLTRRNLDPVKTIFGVYIRDSFGNVTDTTATILTPIEEVMLDKSKFRNAAIADDNCWSTNTSYYPIERLWDGSGRSDYAESKYWFFASDAGGSIPGWLTIDLGVRANLSRIATLPRISYNIWTSAHVRDFEFWGCLEEPSGEPGEGEHGFDDCWFCLGKFTQFKPSGYLADGTVGEYTQEDAIYFNAGNDFELDESEYPRCHDDLRYLRVVFANTFATYELKAHVGQVQIGEITPYGQVLEEYR